ncbi:MAG: hypothetical protein PHH17_01320 [Candidatus Pacebacteria bacterium]|nr:hypothetical protein [Candidatus Paceibacterota bacterium]MDD3728964.1 hypothetical protein [Candidatus Paceibacterota bacterium]MDD4201637.1 hypothetical protein [Candidatus Paceibacterota bacterium]MDD5445833.1 hypothetical protein [Candidatus Paceibacterota bacterium]
MNIIKKIIHIFKRPSVIIFDHNFLLDKFSDFFSKKEIFFCVDEDIDLAKFLVKYSKKPIIIFNEKNDLVKEFSFSKNGIFILNSEFFKKKEEDGFFTYGTKEDSDFKISDINIVSGEVNFKLNYRGSTVPFWASVEFDKNDMGEIAGIIALLFLRGMNLVEISQAIKDVTNSSSSRLK